MRTNIASLCSISSLSSDDMSTLKNISVGDAKLAVSCMFNQLAAEIDLVLWLNYTSCLNVLSVVASSFAPTYTQFTWSKSKTRKKES